MSRLRVLVSGASGGIGAAIVRRLCAEGHEVWASGTRHDALQALALECGCRVLTVDIADADAVQVAFAELPLDAWVHAAARLGPAGALYELRADEARELVETNVLGTLNGLRSIVPGMVRRHCGHVLLIGSIAGVAAQAGPGLYSATKAALHSLVESLRADLYGTPLRVSELLPGRVASGMHASLASATHSAHERFYQGYACLTPEDMAEAVLFILTAPRWVDVIRMEVMPTHQITGGSRFWKAAT